MCLFLGMVRGGWAATVQPFAQGNESVNMQVYPPTSQITVATNVPVAITSTNMVIKSTGGIVTYAQAGRVPSDGPAITTSTALSGQFLILQSTTTADTVVITTGTATAVYGDDTTITISASKAPVLFIYNATLSVWEEFGKQ